MSDWSSGRSSPSAFMAPDRARSREPSNLSRVRRPPKLPSSLTPEEAAPPKLPWGCDGSMELGMGCPDRPERLADSMGLNPIIIGSCPAGPIWGFTGNPPGRAILGLALLYARVGSINRLLNCSKEAAACLAAPAAAFSCSLVAALLFLRFPAPTGTFRRDPPAVQYLWHAWIPKIPCQSFGPVSKISQASAQSPRVRRRQRARDAVTHSCPPEPTTLPETYPSSIKLASYAHLAEETRLLDVVVVVVAEFGIIACTAWALVRANRPGELGLLPFLLLILLDLNPTLHLARGPSTILGGEALPNML